jgi:hypothetical protein
VVEQFLGEWFKRIKRSKAIKKRIILSENLAERTTTLSLSTFITTSYLSSGEVHCSQTSQNYRNPFACL